MMPLLTRPFTKNEYHRMIEAGILREDDRVELIEGNIIAMAPIGSRHVACVNRFNRLLNQALGDRAQVSVQNPVSLTRYSEPQPDIAVLRPREDFYSAALPGPEDILLIVEVADASAVADRQDKLPLYARAGIPEVWLVDWIEERVEVCQEPWTDGSYRVRHSCRSGPSGLWRAEPFSNSSSHGRTDRGASRQF
jgi:Uma2 family endonuclease